MANLPWFKFYAGDWFSDGKLRKCKAEGVAVWIQTLVWMQKEETYEITGDVEEIAMALNLPAVQTDEGIRQLEKHSVCEVSRDHRGVVSLISRRLKSEHDKREAARERKRLERERKRGEGVTEDHNDVTASSTGGNHTDVTDESHIHTRSRALTSDSVSDSSSDRGGEVKEDDEGSLRAKRRLWTKADIERIYQDYPRHVGPDKAFEKIEKALTKVRDGPDPPHDPVEWLLERVGAFARSPAGNQGRYTCHPATWFHQGRYKDDPKEWERDDDGKSTQAEGAGRRTLQQRAESIGKYDKYLEG